MPAISSDDARDAAERKREGPAVRRRMLNGKIHRARVTDADLNYVGSISLDPVLLKAADVLPFEQVTVLNLMNGARIETYAIEGIEGQVCLNGAAARMAEVGDLVIILSYVDVEDIELADHRPSIVFVDDENRVVDAEQ
jgi:aspartate 1-decarboxylase